MKLFTLIGVCNTDGKIYFQHWMAACSKAAVKAAGKDSDVSFIAVLPGRHESFMSIEGKPVKAEDILWVVNDEDDPSTADGVAMFYADDGSCNVYVLADGSVRVVGEGVIQYPDIASAIGSGTIPQQVVNQLKVWEQI